MAFFSRQRDPTTGDQFSEKRTWESCQEVLSLGGSGKKARATHVRSCLSPELLLPLSFIARSFPKPGEPIHNCSVDVPIVWPHPISNAMKKTRKKMCWAITDCFLHTNGLSSYLISWVTRWQPCVSRQTFKFLGRGRSGQTEQEQCCQLPLLPLSMTEEPAENKAWNLWLRTPVSKGWSVFPCPSSSSPSASHSQPHLTLTTLLWWPLSIPCGFPGMDVWQSVTILSYRPWHVILCHNTVPQKTDPQHMLNNPKVLSFYNQELHEGHVVTESNSTVLCNGICFLWGKWGTECLENIPVFS